MKVYKLQRLPKRRFHVLFHDKVKMSWNEFKTSERVEKRPNKQTNYIPEFKQKREVEFLYSIVCIETFVERNKHINYTEIARP